MTSLVSARSDRLLEHLNPTVIFRNLWNHRGIIWQLTRREVQIRYRGSFLGVFWSFLSPLILLLTYTFVFGVVFRARWLGAQVQTLSQFALVLFCGLIVFNIFSECVSRAPSLVVGVPNYVKKVVFPLEVLPVGVLGCAFFHGLVSLIALLIFNLCTGRLIHPSILWSPIVFLPLVFLTLGLSWFLAGLGVFVRDINNTIVLAVQVLIFLTPVFYSVEVVPEPFRTVVKINPLTALVDNFRRVTIWGLGPIWGDILIWMPLTFALMVLGYAWFMKTKRGFADVI